MQPPKCFMTCAIHHALIKGSLIGNKKERASTVLHSVFSHVNKGGTERKGAERSDTHSIDGVDLHNRMEKIK